MLRHSRLSLLAAFSSIAFMAAEVGAGSLPSALDLALRDLDPADNAHWTVAGEPLLSHLEQVTSTSVSRADVDAITEGTKRDAWAEWRVQKWPAPEPEPAPAEPAAEPQPEPAADIEQQQDDGETTAVAQLGADVIVTFPEDQRFDGETQAVAKVVKVLDDGSINVRAYAPNGGADQFITGVRHESTLDDWPEGAAERNLPVWRDI